MVSSKKSLGQNFLIDKNIINKILDSTKLYKRHVIEIGPGRGALTNEIIKRKPKSLIIIEKDHDLSKMLKEKYLNLKNITVYNRDVLKFDIEKLMQDRTIIFGNLPFNISSQILVQMIKFKKWTPKYSDLIFMFQRELGEKIIGSYGSKNYGRLAILSDLRLNFIKKFVVSPNCFRPRPKVESIVIHFKPKKMLYKINDISILEKITNIFFSNKRKMINKNIRKILSKNQIESIKDLKLDQRPADIRSDIYYKIAEVYIKS